MNVNRRKVLQWLGGAASLRIVRNAGAAGPSGEGTTDYAQRRIAHGPFEPTWESLKQYRAPEWFRDAKFGIWAHWSAQCVPEQGDWYARNMYMQGHPQYDYHVAHYGHPSKFGFMQIDQLWKTEAWKPEELIHLYVKAGAKYFVSLANHHDNFDCFDSRYHAWNSMRIGPRKDIVGTWARAAREQGLRFGVSSHASHAWHWFQTAYGYDAIGPLAGVRYDAYTLGKEDGSGQWWEGLDPQELYTARNIVIPDGLNTIKAQDDWHGAHDGTWFEDAPHNPEFVNKWFLRCQDLIDKYHPDLLYFDDDELPFGQAGLDVAAHLYNTNIRRHGRLEAVLNGKNLKREHAGTLVLDLERGRASGILNDPWQTDTCIGDWHYNRAHFDNHTYKSAKTVIGMLVDIVSKNGNLLLSIPVRGNGTIDDDERKVLAGLAEWMVNNGEAIFGTRPFAVYGEGPPDVAATGGFNEGSSRSYTSEDIRFTVKGETLYAFAMAWPEDGNLKIRTLASGASAWPYKIARIEMTGEDTPLEFAQHEDALVVRLPAAALSDLPRALKIQRA